MAKKENLITVRDYANSLNVTTQHIYQQIRDGKIKSKKMFGKVLVIKPE